MARESDVRRIAREAVRRILTHGWIKGSFGDKVRGYCAVGALGADQTYDVHNGAFEARRRAEKILSRRAHNRIKLVEWNDSVRRQKSEVIALLREVARGGGKARGE